MKNTIKNLYNIDTKALIKYSDKVYKIKDENDEDYCLKYVETLCNNNVIEKINTLHLNENFEMPIKNCIRSSQTSYDNKHFYVSKWVEDDLIDSKDLKIKYYLNQIGKLHEKTSYTLNVSISFFNEISMKIEEEIEESFQKYEKLIYNIERLEYKSPFHWYYIEHYKDIVESLNKSKTHLNNFKALVKNKSTIRQVITHQNFSYDHVFISKDKIIGNDKLKLTSPVYDIKSLFDNIDFGSIDVSGMIDEYIKNISLEDYELEWLFSLLFIVDFANFNYNDFDNINALMKLKFKYKSVCELENKIAIKNST